MKHVCEGQCLLSCLQFAFTPFLARDMLQPLMNVFCMRGPGQRTGKGGSATNREEIAGHGFFTGSARYFTQRQRRLPILTSCIHWTPCVPMATRENPIVAPTMQWVPDIGSFKNDAISCQTAEPGTRRGKKKCGINNNSDDNVTQKILRHVPTFF